MAIRKSAAALIMAATLGTAVAYAQLAVINRSKPMTITGEVVVISCYQTEGMKGTGAAHLPHAKQMAKEGAELGVLTDGDGLFRIVGKLTEQNNAKIAPYLGQIVELAGTQVGLSNSYTVRQSFDTEKITPAKPQPR